MDKVNPILSQNFLEAIKSQTSKIVNIDGLRIKTSKNVFPPESQFSHSSIDLYKIFGDQKNASVLDVGTGTGIQAMQAIKNGASKAIAIDISQDAVACAKENVLRNKMENKITVIKSDLFEYVPEEKFDMIIANLPITDFPMHGIIESALYDPEWSIHKRFFNKVRKYLSESGRIIISHANLQSEHSFDTFEIFIRDSGFKIDQFIEYDTLGYKWRMYRLS